MGSEEKKAELEQFPVSKIRPSAPLPSDIYLFIDQKYIMYKKKGDILESEKINFFISKGLKHIFVEKEKINEFSVEIEKIQESEIEKMVSEIGEEARSIVVKREELSQKLFDVFTEQELTSANVKLIEGMSKNFITDLVGRKNIASLVEKLHVLGDLAMDHAINVGNLAIFIAMSHGQGDQNFLENLYIASLLHDFGKLKIPSSLLEKGKGPAYSKAIQDHPTKGVQSIKKIKGISEEVILAIEQHHEQFNGRGYPKSLSGNEIKLMSRFLSIANIYDNVFSENKSKNKDEAHKQAIKVIEYDRGKLFDPQMLPRIIDSLKLAYGNYYK